MNVENRSFTKGDRLRSPHAFLTTADGNAVDLTGETVAFRMVNASTGAVKVDGKAAVIVDAAAGEVRYDWDAADIDTVGQYWAWFIRTSGGQTEHFPVGRLFKITIEDDV